MKDTSEIIRGTKLETTMSKIRYTHFEQHAGGEYYPSLESIPRLPSGVYEFGHSHTRGTFVKRIQVFSDHILDLPMRESLLVFDDVTTFWNSTDNYTKLSMLHKRGILLFGPAGNGKTGLIRRLINYMIKEKDGIIFNIRTEDCVANYQNFVLGCYRKIEPDRPILVIMEDFNELCSGYGDLRSTLLGLLDGITQINHVVYLCTTNSASSLDKRFVMRPGRFDRLVKFTFPNEEVRRYYLQNRLSQEMLDTIDVDDFVAKTKDFSLAALKELIVSVFSLGYDFEQSLSVLKQMRTKPTHHEDNDLPSVGFHLNGNGS